MEAVSQIQSRKRKAKFTENEDKQLKEVIAQIGENWTEVSKRLPGRNARQCRDRWIKYLSPETNRAPFSLTEDLLLLTLYEQMGPHWVAMSKQFQHRSDSALKCRFKTLNRYGLEKGILSEHLSGKKQTVDCQDRKDVSNKISNDTIQIEKDSGFGGDDLFCGNFFDEYLQ